MQVPLRIYNSDDTLAPLIGCWVFLGDYLAFKSMLLLFSNVMKFELFYLYCDFVDTIYSQLE